MNVMCYLHIIQYLWIKPPKTFNVDKTDETLSYFRKKLK